jgi:hypothetical protein
VHLSVVLALLLTVMAACSARVVSGEGGTTGSTASGTTGSSGVGSTSDSSSGAVSMPTSTGPTCEGYTATFDVPIVTLSAMLMLDQSPAMLDPWDHDGDPQTPEQPRWTSVRKALLAVFPGMGDLRLGLAPYPTPDAQEVDGAAACAVTPGLFVPTSDALPIDVLAGLEPASPAPGSFVGGAPLRDALTTAVALTGGSPDQPRVVVVLANSAANCDPNAAGPALLETYDAGGVAVAAAASAMGVRVFVFGIGAATEVSAKVVDHRPDDVIVSDTLAELAAAGGGSYVNVASEGELISKMAATFAHQPGLLTCAVFVEPEPGPDQAVTGVRVAGQDYAAVEDCSVDDGWQFIDGAVQLCGAACTQFNVTGDIEIFVTCV